MVKDELGGWRPPFTVIGCIGMFWIVPWLFMIRRNDLYRTPTIESKPAVSVTEPTFSRGDLWRMFAVLVVIVFSINLTWQYFRNWLPKYLEESHDYSKMEVGWFTSAYYASTDVGCLAVGFLVKWLVDRGWEVHRARLITFTACAGLVLLAVAVAFLPTGPLLLTLLLFVAAGTLGLYPNYYSFSQELTSKHQGKISGALGTIAWIGSGTMQALVGKNIDETKSYVTGIVLAALLLFWPARRCGSFGNDEAIRRQ